MVPYGTSDDAMFTRDLAGASISFDKFGAILKVALSNDNFRALIPSTENSQQVGNQESDSLKAESTPSNGTQQQYEEAMAVTAKNPACWIDTPSCPICLETPENPVQISCKHV